MSDHGSTDATPLRTLHAPHEGLSVRVQALWASTVHDIRFGI